MSWEQSSAAARLRAAAAVEVGAPPPLAAVREVAGKRARRAAMMLAFALAIPVGSLAAVGGVYAVKRNESPLPHRGEGQGEGAVRVKKVLPPVKVEAPIETAPAPVASAPVAVPVRAPAPKAVSRAVVPAPSPLSPTLSPPGERESVGGSLASPPPLHTSLADESRALTAALSALRVQHDAAHALTLLVEYRTHFPSGTLRREAALATVEAHRALGHTAEALAALDELPHRPDLDVLRAELAAELGRCAEARTLLQTIQPAGPLRERVLFTDATCALSLGARDEARVLLEQLPESERARSLLEKLK